MLATTPSVVLAEAGFYVTPSVSVSEVYDDNIFNTPSEDTTEPSSNPTPVVPTTHRNEREDDFITRGSAGLKAGYQSQPFTLLAGYEFEGEAFADHTDQSNAPSKQAARLDSTYASERRYALTLHGQYAETRESRELNAVTPEPTVTSTTPNALLVPVTTLETRRARAELYDLGPSLRYDLDPLTTADTGFTYSHAHQVGSSTNDTYLANADLTRKLDERNTLEGGYDYRRFDIDEPSTKESAATPPDENAPRDRKIDSHAVTAGGQHDFSPATRLHVRGGARFTDGDVDPQVSAELSHRLRRGQVELRYEETVTTAVGVADVLKTRGVVGLLDYDLAKFWNARLLLSYYRNTESSGADADVYRVAVTLSYRMLEWLTARASYSFSYQDGSLGSVTGSSASRDEHTRHNLVIIGVEASKPYRVY